jgi:16S rRNA (adenine1518-N6/adenine1519-N6)-dimethyltransferase
MDTKEVRGMLTTLGLRARKGLGQNFLVDEHFAERAVAHADINDGETVLEIGPGLGVLTGLLAAKARKVIAVETEARFIGLVKKANVEYIHGDALKVELPRFDKVVSNLPYSISTPVTFRLLGPGIDFKAGVLMYQLEFAERLAAGPGSKVFGRLSVSAYVRAKIELLDKVPSCAFFPRPKVESRLVRLTPRPPPFETKDWDLYHRVVKVAFAQRRKKLRNSLRNGLGELAPPFRALGEPDMEKVPYGDERPEDLTPEQLGEVSDFLCQNG